MEVLIRLVTWALGYILNALSFIHIGKQNEKEKNQEEQLTAISKANNLESNFKRDDDKLNKLRKLYKR